VGNVAGNNAATAIVLSLSITCGAKPKQLVRGQQSLFRCVGHRNNYLSTRNYSSKRLHDAFSGLSFTPLDPWSECEASIGIATS
jgi:hypothetical protein